MNESFLDILGYSEEEVIGEHHQILLDENDKESNNSFWETLSNGEFQSGRFKRKHKNGSLIWIQASYSPVLNSKKEVIRVTKIAQNITSEIKAQEALEKAKSLADELNIQKDHFIANVSHEIRTPINAVLGFTELLLDEETDNKKVNYLKSVKTAGDNLLYLINDIIDLSLYLDFIDNARIINRWGNTVAILTKDNPIWDGSNCTDGIYYYLIEDEKIKTKQNGFIHLMR